MPIEIKELQISVTVNDQQPMSAASAPGKDSDKDEKKKLCRECIDDMMDILNSKKER